MIMRKFSRCSPDVKCFLFKSYCSNLYCSILWYDCSKTVLKTLRITYNNSLRNKAYQSIIVLMKCLSVLTFLLLVSFLESMCNPSETD